MAVTKNENTFSSTYKDDFSEGDNYQRILFNSGRALQARELTQMQTIIQKQMERFGRNIFKEGSVVIPGGLVTDNEIQYVRLQGTPTLYVGDILTESGTGIKARVIDFIAAEGTHPKPAMLARHRPRHAVAYSVGCCRLTAAQYQNWLSSAENPFHPRG